jgi:hypothetical protein
MSPEDRKYAGEVASERTGGGRHTILVVEGPREQRLVIRNLE